MAFYGGSFTGLDRNLQEYFLDAAYKFVTNGLIDSIRVSTRPDYITDDGLLLLKRYRVTTVELGVQSMVDDVLRLSGRGHTAEETVNAVMLLKKYGFNICLQLMPGLPGDTEETILYTASKIIELKPDFARIYPTLVVRNTPLEEMYLRGRYTPWSLADMADVCRKLISLFNERGIPVIRLGLPASEALKEAVVAGPYHPSFGGLVKNHMGRLQR